MTCATKNLIIVAILMVLMTTVVFAQPPVTPPGRGQGAALEEEPFYYGWKGKKTRLTEVQDRIGIIFEDGANPGQKRAVLQSGNRLNPSADQLNLDVLATIGAMQVRLAPGTRGQERRSAMADVRAQNIVAAVNPILRTSSRGESFLTNMFYVSVSAAAEVYTDMEQQFAADGLEIVKKTDYSKIGQMGYRLRVPKAARNAHGKNAMGFANSYHEDRRTTHATPTFAPMYQVFTSLSLDPPNDGLFDVYDPAKRLLFDASEWEWTQDPVTEVWEWTSKGETWAKDQDGKDDMPYGYWHFRLMNVPQAWKSVYQDMYGWKGGDGDPPTNMPEIVVAQLDNGVMMDYTSRDIGGLTPPTPTPSEYSPYGGSMGPVLGGVADLNPNQWINEAEIAGDDGNDYDDDYFGWDFVGNDITTLDGDRIPMPDRVSRLLIGNQDGTVEENKMLFGEFPNHGTWAACQTSARVNNDSGATANKPTEFSAAGVAFGSKVMPLRYHANANYGNVLRGSIGVYYNGRAEAAINYAAKTKLGADPEDKVGAHVIALMCSIETYDVGFHNAIKNARANGCVIFHGCHNLGISVDSEPRYPTVWPETISVAGASVYDLYDAQGILDTDPNERRELFSNYGWAVNVVAPRMSVDSYHESGDGFPDWGQGRRPIMGNIIGGAARALEREEEDEEENKPWSEDKRNRARHMQYYEASGNSAAMPLAAGVAALILTVDPALSPAEVQAFMQWSAKDLDYTANVQYDSQDWIQENAWLHKVDPDWSFDYRRSQDVINNATGVYDPQNPDGYSDTPPYVDPDLTNNWDEVAGPGRDRYTGWGRLRAAKKDSTDPDDGAVEWAQRSRFAVQNKAGKNVMSIDEKGNFVIDGKIEEGLGLGNISKEPDYAEWVVEDNSNPVKVLALLAPEWADNGGDWPKLKLAGTFTEHNGSPDGTWTNDIASSVFDLSDETGQVIAFINSSGNMHVRDKAFIGADPNPDGVTEVARDETDVTKVDVPGEPLPMTLQQLIDKPEVQDGDIIELAPGTYVVTDTTGPIDFKGKNIIIRSSDPYNWDVVKGTVLKSTSTSDPVVKFSGTETQEAGLIGFTIKGGKNSGIYCPDDGLFYEPRDVAVDSMDNIYVADTKYHRIQKFKLNTVYHTKFGDINLDNDQSNTREGDGEFKSPGGVTVDSSGNVYVADTVNHRIQKLDSDGFFLAKWGGSGTGNGQFSSPTGVAVYRPAVQADLCTGGTPSADSVYTPGSWTAAQAFDDDDQTAWSSTDTALPHWLRYDLAVSTAVKSYTLTAYFTMTGKMPEDWTFEGYNGTTWDTLDTRTGETGWAANEKRTFSCANQNEVYQYYRINITKNGSGNRTIIGEMEIFDDGYRVFVADRGNDRIQEFNSSGSYLNQWGSYGSANGDFDTPGSVAVDSSGNVYVADTGNHRVQKFDSSGTYLTKSGKTDTPFYGSANGEFNSPSGIALDTSGNIYVADTGNNRIQKLSSIGAYLEKSGSSGPGNGQFSSPSGVAVDSSGNIYVTDGGSNDRIQKFNSSLTYVTQWGTDGTGNGQFKDPGGVAVDSSGNVFVADTVNHRVQKFILRTAFDSNWGSFGTSNGQFKSPSGVAVGPSGYIYVADTGNHKIQKFSSGGTHQNTWGSQGTGNVQFESPRGVEVDSSGNIYVADSGNHRIQKLDSSGGHLNTWGSEGTGVGYFDNPSDVAVDSNGDIYVADTGNSKIQKYDGADWSYLNGTFSIPSGIEVDSSDDVYVADTGNHQIQKFDSDGTYLSQWGEWGSSNEWVQWGEFVSGNDKLNHPHGVAIGPNGLILVADTVNNSIESFLPDPATGIEIPRFGKWGTLARIMYNHIYDNAGTNGGAIYNCDGVIDGNVIGGFDMDSDGDNGGGNKPSGDSNTATGDGGGLSHCDGFIGRNLVLYNEASGDGGGIAHCSGLWPYHVHQNLVAFNKADNGGGLAGCLADVRGNMIYDNDATGDGGGLYDCDYALKDHNTIYENSANVTSGSGGGMYDCDAANRHNIIYKNTANTYPQTDQKIAPEYSCIEGWTSGGTANISADPGFDETNPRLINSFLHLDSASPCVDPANSPVGTTFRDFDDQSGPLNGDDVNLAEPDMGADEYRTPESYDPNDPYNPEDGAFIFWWEHFCEKRPAFEGTDINEDSAVDASDVQLVINAALGIDISPYDADVNADGAVNAADVQITINTSLGKSVEPFHVRSGLLSSAAKLTLGTGAVNSGEVAFAVNLELGAATVDCPSTINATLTFDPLVITPSDTSAFDTNAAFGTAYGKTLEGNDPTSGIVKIVVGGINTNEITDATIEVGTITFDITGSTNDSTNLTWSDVRMTDGTAFPLENTSGDPGSFIVP